MTQKIGIGVEATFDSRAVEQGVEELSSKIKRANREPLNPVSPNAAKQLDAVNQKFQQLLRVDGELRRRMKATGQGGKLFEDIDWNATHPDAVARAKKINSVHDYLGVRRPAGAGGGAGGGGGGRPPGAPPAPNTGGPGMGAGIIQAGLRAAGPAGGVAAGALGTGMASGAGAGLMGLMGGMLALGVGKVIGSVMDKIGQAEDNNVAFDRLKRTLGDVNISFDGLKSVVTAGADNMKVTYAEFGALGSQFAKSGNMSSGQYASLADEVGTGIGMSRAFGLDPSQGVGLMGQMRGMKITSDVNESKKFALLIGETIGKSGAFAKADEVMEAIGGYATMQTRNSMGRANVEGYAGMYSGMVGSGIAGMDPAGAAGMLARINASLAAGGSKGEASQFFTARVGARMGLDPIQTQILREGGAFATNDEAFGKGSAAARYGMAGPGGGKTFLQGSLEELRGQYGNNKGLLAQATANHLGIGMRQSMALLSIDPNQMGGMQKYAGDLTKLNAGGIGNLSKVVYGTDDDRADVARNLIGRDDVSGTEKDKINFAMAGTNVELQKSTLAAIVASRDQEMTTGKDIRDSKNALDNIKTTFADKLVPIALEMRHGIMAIAGAGNKKSSQEIMQGVIEADSAARVRSIVNAPQQENSSLRERQSDLENRRRALDPVNLAVTYRDKPEILEKKLKERAEVVAELTFVEKRLKDLEEEKNTLLKKENERKAKELAGLNAGIEARRQLEEAEAKIGAGSSRAAGKASIGAGSGGAAAGKAIKAADPKIVQEAMNYFMSEEGGGWSKEQAAGIVSNLVGESQMNPAAFNGDGGGRGAQGQAQWRGPRITEFEQKYGKSVLNASHKEQWAYVNHELTMGRKKAVGDRLRQTKDPRASGTLVSKDYEIHGDASVDAARGAYAEKLAGTPMPAGAAAGPAPAAAPATGSAEVTVHLKDEATGKERHPPVTVQTKLKQNGQPLRQ